MKFFVVVAVTFLIANSDALFFGKGSGNLQLSGNFHGLGGHPWLGKPAEAPVVTEAPVVITEAPVIVPESPTESRGHGFNFHGQLHGLFKNHRLLSGFHGKKESAPIVTEAPIITEAPVIVPAAPVENKAHSFNIHGQLQGLFKNHRLLSKFHGNREAAPVPVPAPAPIPEVIEPQPEVVPAAPSKGFDIHGQLQGLFKNHRLLSGGGSGFNLQGNLHGLLRNHRLFNKNQVSAPTTTEDPFGGDNTGFSVSTGESGSFDVDAGSSIPTGDGNYDFSEASNSNAETNSFSEVAAIPEPSPISNDVSSAGVSGSFTASAQGGHNFHKVLGNVVDAKIKLLDQAKTQVAARFDNHIRNLDKLKAHFDKSQASAPAETSIGGQFTLEKRRY